MKLLQWSIPAIFLTFSSFNIFAVTPHKPDLIMSKMLGDFQKCIEKQKIWNKKSKSTISQTLSICTNDVKTKYKTSNAVEYKTILNLCGDVIFSCEKLMDKCATLSCPHVDNPTQAIYCKDCFKVREICTFINYSCAK